jgi:ParB family chromosome partitioning protein
VYKALNLSRLTAVGNATLHATIPAVIRRVPDEAAIAMALIENIQRENLNPLEEARALERLIAEFHVTHEQAADAVGRSRAAVSNLLRLLQLAPDVADMVEKHQLEMGHARALLSLTNRRSSARRAATRTASGSSRGCRTASTTCTCAGSA